MRKCNYINYIVLKRDGKRVVWQQERCEGHKGGGQRVEGIVKGYAFIAKRAAELFKRMLFAIVNNIA